ncbi:MAG: UDP-N-acetylmuramoyl-tripeptide--D-alanyl-D-alanine ligase [Acidimicrobiales bacterium]
MAFSTDTRTIEPGDTYVAIRGERFDGHDFVEQAVERGASTVIVERASVDAGLAAPVGVEMVVVDDTVGHLTALASERVRRAGADVVAITGSVGKTTTKGAIVAVLRQSFPVVYAHGNLNTPLGLSLTVLNADVLDQAATVKIVMEMGARLVGDIRELVSLFPPTVSVVTNVKPVHLETFGSIEAIEHEKGELIAGLRSDGTGVLNADDPRVAAMAVRTTARCVTFGRSETADIGPGAVTVPLPILGDHAVMTAMSAIAVGRSLGMDDTAIGRGLSAIVPEPGRLVRLRGRSGSTLVDDTYNASPDATIASLDVLASLPATRRIAYLGDMLELGPDEISEHTRVLLHAVAVADEVIVVGPRMEKAAEDLSVDRYADSTLAAAAIASDPTLAPRAGDAILVKGSQGIRMERVSEALLDPEVDPAEVLPRQAASWKAK